MKDKNTTIPFGADEIMNSFLKSNGAPLTDSELKRIKHTESLKDLMALGYIRHEHSNVFLTLQGRMALRQFDEEHKSKSNKESANVFSIIVSVLAILVSILNTVAGLVKNDATVNYASINSFTYMLSALEAMLIGFFVSEIILPSVKYFRFHPVVRVLFGTMAAVLLYFYNALDSRWYPIHPKLRKAFTDLSAWYIAFSGRVQPLVDPVDPDKVNVPVEVGLQLLGKHSRKAPWGVSQLRAESFSISMRFYPHALQAQGRRRRAYVRGCRVLTP